MPSPVRTNMFISFVTKDPYFMHLHCVDDTVFILEAQYADPEFYEKFRSGGIGVTSSPTSPSNYKEILHFGRKVYPLRPPEE